MCLCLAVSACVCMQPVMSVVLIHYVLWSGCLPVVCMYLGSADPCVCSMDHISRSIVCVCYESHIVVGQLHLMVCGGTPLS